VAAAQNDSAPPNPGLIFETLNAFHRTAALKAAIDLDVFTGIGEGATSASVLAKKFQATERGMRILCDYLVITGFLTKSNGQYALTPDSAIFLDRRSPAYMGTIARFITLPQITASYQNLAEIVRKGHPPERGQEVLETENLMWVEFARSMAPLQAPAAQAIAGMLDSDAGQKWKVLDIAAGHGLFGIAVAKRNRHAEIYAVDWPAVLAVASENARAAGVEARHHTIPGSAFEVDLGSGYDVILLTGFLHHFDPASIDRLLRKLHAALSPHGQVVTLEFVPNDDRVSPPDAASFSMVMLGTTPAGDAYPFSEYDRMFQKAGFSRSELRRLPDGPQSVILSRK
jgi:hypothetical protein